jgi:hypothetical protein
VAAARRTAFGLAKAERSIICFVGVVAAYAPLARMLPLE